MCIHSVIKSPVWNHKRLFCVNKAVFFFMQNLLSDKIFCVNIISDSKLCRLNKSRYQPQRHYLMISWHSLSLLNWQCLSNLLSAFLWCFPYYFSVGNNLLSWNVLVFLISRKIVLLRVVRRFFVVVINYHNRLGSAKSPKIC